MIEDGNVLLHLWRSPGRKRKGSQSEGVEALVPPALMVPVYGGTGSGGANRRFPMLTKCEYGTHKISQRADIHMLAELTEAGHRECQGTS